MPTKRDGVQLVLVVVRRTRKRLAVYKHLLDKRSKHEAELNAQLIQMAFAAERANRNTHVLADDLAQGAVTQVVRETVQILHTIEVLYQSHDPGLSRCCARHCRLVEAFLAQHEAAQRLLGPRMVARDPTEEEKPYA